LGHSRILVSVYDPTRNLNAKMLAGEMQRLLTAVQSYLGGKLPVKKYAFLSSILPTILLLVQELLSTTALLFMRFRP
jgi:hypothetical protein